MILEPSMIDLSAIDVNIIIGSLLGVVIGAIITFFLTEHQHSMRSEQERFPIFQDVHLRIKKIIDGPENISTPSSPLNNTHTLFSDLKNQINEMKFFHKDIKFVSQVFDVNKSLREREYEKTKIRLKMRGKNNMILQSNIDKVDDKYWKIIEIKLEKILFNIRKKNMNRHKPYGYPSLFLFKLREFFWLKRTFISKLKAEDVRIKEENRSHHEYLESIKKLSIEEFE